MLHKHDDDDDEEEEEEDMIEHILSRQSINT
jgi:hypothetical protein